MKEVGPQVVTFRASNALNAQEGSVTVEVIRAPEIQLRILKILFGMNWDSYHNSHAGGVRYCFVGGLSLWRPVNFILNFWPKMTLSKLDMNFFVKIAILNAY